MQIVELLAVGRFVSVHYKIFVKIWADLIWHSHCTVLETAKCVYESKLIMNNDLEMKACVHI